MMDGHSYTMSRQGIGEFISTQEGLLNFIEQLRGGANRRWKFEMVREVIQEMVHHFGDKLYQSYAMPVEWAGNITTIHRVRDIRDGPFDFAEQLGSPDERLATKLGRCNVPGVPVCYCSLYEDTALAEVGAQTGHDYVVATFELTEKMILLPVGELDFYRRTGQTYLGSAHPRTTEHYANVYRNLPDARLRELTDAFFAEEFMAKAATESDYRLTAALSEVLFHLPFETVIDAIMYPSVAFRAGYNFAIRRDSEKRKLRLAPFQTRIVRVTEALGYGIFDTKVVQQLRSIGEDGRLDWEPVSGE